MPMYVLAAAFGAALAFFLDPANGRGRRARLAQQAPAFFRRRGRQAARAGQAVAAEAYGLKEQVTHPTEEPKDLNDETLAAKVKTEIFRDADLPKGQIEVNVQEGVVQLRGEVSSPDLIDELAERVRSIQGIRSVENLLHVPGADAPMHQ